MMGSDDLPARMPVGIAGLVLTLALAAACGDSGEETSGVSEGSPSETSEQQAILQLGDPELAPFTGDLDAMRERRVIRALVVPSRTDFFLDHGQIKGIQAELLRELEKFLNTDRRRPSERIRIKYVPVAFAELLPALESGKGDLVAAFLTETPARRERIRFVPALRSGVAEVVVTNRSAPTPETVEDLAGRQLHVLRGSSYAGHLAALNERLRARELAPIAIEEADPRLESEDLLELVSSGVLEATVVDDYKADLWARVLPGIVVHDDVAVATGRAVGWAVRRDATQLAAELGRFTERARAGTLLGNVLFERYFRDERWIDDPTARAERDKLRRYISLFEKYGEQYGFEPLALAAQAYQESRLDQSRRSHRGAIGLMQLLPSTARDPNVGIPDIHEAESNVHAGVRYLAFLRDRYFSDPGLDSWNRAAFALAAYNAGPRRIREARDETARLGLDPDVWFDNVEVATGRSVGREPVRYVANIYKYYVAYRLVFDRREERARATAP